jgi:hypothetical protein
MKFAEGFEMPASSGLADLETWVNVHPSILKIGRTKHLYEETPEDWDDDRKAAYDAMKEEDKPDDQFRNIKEHVPMPGQEFAWTSKTVGDKQTYTPAEGGIKTTYADKGEGSVSYAVNVIRSLRWPGAVTVAKGGKFTNVYIGYGIKKGDEIFNPTMPPEVQRDPEETPQAKEPEPKPPADEPKPEGEGEEGGEPEDE